MRRVLALLIALVMPFWAQAQELTALARLDAAQTVIEDRRGEVIIELQLSQPVPYRIRYAANPYRIVIDFSEVDWGSADWEALNKSSKLDDIRSGPLSAGWSRMVLDLAEPMTVTRALVTRADPAGPAVVNLAIGPASEKAFAARAALATQYLSPNAEGTPLDPPLPRQDGSRPLRIVLDPGHGGIDPGAERGGLIEANLMLTFARELAELLRRDGAEVTLTRSEDVFVPLEARLSIARAARADLFLSLHADVVAEGVATGATVYTLSNAASETAAQKLAERHDRSDLLAGVDLSQQDDVVANILMDMARTETAPRSDALASALVDGLQGTIGRLHKRPKQAAAFSVLKAPDIPSVLLELGFMSSPQDLKNLQDSSWRARAADGVRNAIFVWAKDDAAQARLLRQ